MAYDTDNIFAKILRGELPCTPVYEDDYALAFPDITPQAPVHVLVIPKGAYIDMEDFSANATDAEIAGYFRAVGETARVLGVVDAGYRALTNTGRDAHQIVPHLHMHIFAGRDLGGMIKRFET